MIIGLTFNQIVGGLFWAFIAGFIAACVLLAVVEMKKGK